MRLNLRTDYGLRVLMYLLARPGERASVDSMAESFDVSSHHLTKVVQRLARGGFVETYRGRAGGVMLSRQASEINLGDVVRVLEADFSLVECFLAEENKCCFSPTCRLRGIVSEALASFIDVFSRYSLADLDTPSLGQLTERNGMRASDSAGIP